MTDRIHLRPRFPGDSDGGYVVRSELVPITLYQNTPKERRIECGVVVLSENEPKGETDEQAG